MEAAVNGDEGATARSCGIKDIIVCGKTGTAQNPHGKEPFGFYCFCSER